VRVEPRGLAAVRDTTDAIQAMVGEVADLLGRTG
jgi:hypothetical protein